MAARRRNEPVSARPFVGMSILAGDFFLYAASGTVGPWWLVPPMLLVWAAFLFVGLAWWRFHPTWLPWLGLGCTLAWFALLVPLSILLG